MKVYPLPTLVQRRCTINEACEVLAYPFIQSMTSCLCENGVQCGGEPHNTLNMSGLHLSVRATVLTLSMFFSPVLRPRAIANAVRSRRCDDDSARRGCDAAVRL